MPKKQITRANKELIIEFRSDPQMGFSWSVRGEVPQGHTIMGGGHESALELFGDGNFLETLAWGLGEGSIPESVVKAAKDRDEKRQLPIPDEAVTTLEATFPGKVIDSRYEP